MPPLLSASGRAAEGKFDSPQAGSASAPKAHSKWGGDIFRTAIDDKASADADLRLADEGTAPACDPRHSEFIDHILLDKRAGTDLVSLSETHDGPGERHFSDHCPVAITLAR